MKPMACLKLAVLCCTAGLVGASAGFGQALLFDDFTGTNNQPVNPSLWVSSTGVREDGAGDAVINPSINFDLQSVASFSPNGDQVQAQFKFSSLSSGNNYFGFFNSLAQTGPFILFNRGAGGLQVYNGTTSKILPLTWASGAQTYSIQWTPGAIRFFHGPVSGGTLLGTITPSDLAFPTGPLPVTFTPYGNDNTTLIDSVLVTVPEPSSMALIGSLAGLWLVRRRVGRSAGVAALILCALLAARSTGRAQVITNFFDDFTGTAGTAPDPSKWSTTPNPTVAGAYSRVMQCCGSDLVIASRTDLAPGFAQTLSAFAAGNVLRIRTDNSAGANNTQGADFGFMNDQRFVGGGFNGLAIYGETTSQANITFHVSTNGNQSADLFTVNSGIQIETNQEIRIEWDSPFVVRFVIDNGINGSPDFQATFTSGVSLLGPQKVQLEQNGAQGPFNLVVDNVLVTIPEPSTVALLAAASWLLVRRCRPARF